MIFPVSLLRVAMAPSERACDTLRGTALRSEVAGMQTEARLYELVDYETYNAFDTSVYDFSLDQK